MAEKKLPLGKLLIQKGVISDDQLRIALIEQKRTGEPLGKLLVSLGFVTEATVREALSENLNQQSTDLTGLIVVEWFAGRHERAVIFVVAGQAGVFHHDRPQEYHQF